MFIKHLFVILAVTLLFGCATVPPEQSLAKLMRTESCCLNLSEIPFRPLQPYQQQEYRLDNEAAFDFPQGKSYFIALKRPDNSQFLEVTSWLNGAFITHASVVSPLLTVLDKDKAPLTTLRPLDNWRRGLPIQPHTTRNPFYTVRFTLPEDAYYLLVHADTSKTDAVTPYHHRAPNGANFYVDIRFSVSGRLTVTFI